MKIYDGATLLGTVTANGSGAWSYTTAALADGAHSLTATATDAAGNTSAASAALSVTVDTAAPGVPTVSSFSSDTGMVGDGITNDNTLTLTGTAEANSTVKVYDGATLLGTVDRQWQRRLELHDRGAGERHAQPDGDGDGCGRQHRRRLGNLERDGRRGGADSPVIASFSTDTGTVGDGITSDNTLTLTGTAEANSTVKLYDGATLLGQATANGSGAWSYTTGGARERHAQPDGDGDRCGRQHRRGLGGLERDGRHGGAERAGDRLVLDRHRHGRRRHHQRQHAHADRHGRGQQHGEGVRRSDAARHGHGQRQRCLELHHGGSWQTARTASRQQPPMRPATPARRQRP